jgi:hypothetical protein
LGATAESDNRQDSEQSMKPAQHSSDLATKAEKIRNFCIIAHIGMQDVLLERFQIETRFHST